MEISLTGRTALITGGSKGLGLATAARFAASGADVAIWARGAAGLEEARQRIGPAARGRVVALACDVADAGQVERVFAETVQALGTVDILVNNAGGSMTAPFLETTDAMWQADLDTKLFAAIRLSRLAWPHMQQRRWGRILNVLNTLAKAPPAGKGPTAVTRAAGMALTKVLAGEGAPHNILVNALLVGTIESDQWARKAERAGRDLADLHRELGAAVPLGRIGTAEEFANVACFLASDAGSYVTGTAINVDGGKCPVA